MGFPLDLIWLVVPAYIILQFVVIRRSTGGPPVGWRQRRWCSWCRLSS